MGIDIFSILSGSSVDSSLIPHRDSGAATGSQFIAANMALTGNTREQNILNEFLHGNMPDFMRIFVPITVSSGNDSISYLVLPDVLCIGSNEDYVRIPMCPRTAKTIGDKYDCTLPTKKMAQDIWKAAINKISPHPHGPPYDASMFSTQRYQWHNGIIQYQINNTQPLGILTGHKKDVIIDKQLLTNRGKVGIFGWFQLDGTAIQGPLPNCTAHDINYVDYSHSVRLIAQDVVVNGHNARFYDVLKDPTLYKLISEQGPYDATAIYK